MASIGELFRSDRVNADETMQKLHELSGGADINQIYADDKKATDAFPDDLFELDDEPEEPLLEAGAVEGKLEAYNFDPPTDFLDSPIVTAPMPAYETVSDPAQPAEWVDDRQPKDESDIQATLTRVMNDLPAKREVAPHANSIHIEEEQSPEDKEALKNAHFKELASVAAELIQRNYVIARHETPTTEWIDEYKALDARLNDLFEQCRDDGVDPATLEMFAYFQDQTLLHPEENGLKSPEQAIEFNTPGSSQFETIETVSIDPFQAEQAKEVSESVENEPKQDKYPANTRVKAVSAGKVTAGWRVGEKTLDEDGTARYTLYNNRDESTLEGFSEQDLDTFQKLDVTPEDESLDLKGELNELRASAKEKVDAVTGEIKTIASEVRESETVENLIEKGQKLREWWDGGGRDRIKGVFGLKVMAEKWQGALLNPYYKLSGEVSTRLAIRRERIDMMYPQGTEAREKMLQSRRVKYIVGASVYVAYRAFASYNGLNNGGGGLLDHMTQGGSGGSELLGGGALSNGGNGGHEAIIAATETPHPSETLDLSNINPDPDVHIGEVHDVTTPSPSHSVELLAPSPSASHTVEATPDYDYSGESAPAPDWMHSGSSHQGSILEQVAPQNHEAVTATIDIKPIRSNEGGIDWFKRNGLTEKDWYNKSNDMYNRFRGDFYKSGNDIRLNHTGEVSKGLQQYLSDLKKKG